MKHILFIAIILFSGTKQLYAQKSIDKTRLKCQYTFVSSTDTIEKKTRDDILILQIGGKFSKCFSYYSDQVDSIYALPNYYEIMKQQLNYAFSKKDLNTNDYAHKREKAYIYKNYPEGKMTVTDGLSMQDYIYTDDLNAQEWQIEDSIKIILNYPCQKATCDFRGRKWTAWFTPDIPISDGPWKFGGLPGLIMEVSDHGGHYLFTITGLEKKEGESIVFSKTYVGSKRFEKTNRVSFLKAKKKYLMDMSGFIEMETGVDLGSSASTKIMHYDLIEKDYR